MTFICGTQRLTFTDLDTIEEYRRPSAAAVNALEYLRATEQKLGLHPEPPGLGPPHDARPSLVPAPLQFQPQVFYGRSRGTSQSSSAEGWGGAGYAKRGQSPYSYRRDNGKRPRSSMLSQGKFSEKVFFFFFLTSSSFLLLLFLCFIITLFAI